MIIFLTIILSLYGLLNFYAFQKARVCLNLSGRTQGFVSLFLVCLILTPFIVRLLEKLDMEGVAKGMAYVGYLWMAFIFLFFFIHLALDLSGFIIRLVFHKTNSFKTGIVIFLVSVAVSLALTTWGFFDAKNVRVKTIRIPTEKLPAPLKHLRIVQVSDLHLGLIVQGDRLNTVIERIRQAQPDVLVSTGDLLDSDISRIHDETSKFAGLNPPYGKYAVMGNHEYYAGIKKSLLLTRQAGFEILRNESKKVAGITLIGLDDPTGRHWALTEKHVKPHAFSEIRSDEFVLLLKHQPTIRKGMPFDLQLSGHTHGGQIFPFMFMTKVFFPFYTGLHELPDNMLIYISNGTGTWGPPVRFLAQPEITVIDLIKK